MNDSASAVVRLPNYLPLAGSHPTTVKNYKTLSEATNDLNARGYTLDFNLSPDVGYPAQNLQLYPEDFVIDEFHRFEGMSNTDDNSIVYAISSKAGLKGVLVDAYGVYSASLNEDMIRKLRIKR